MSKRAVTLGESVLTVAQAGNFVSANFPMARFRTLNLYRRVNRLVPGMITQYNLCFTPRDMRMVIRKDFIDNQSVTSVEEIDKLILSAVTELEETRKMWKQTCHVEQYFRKFDGDDGWTISSSTLHMNMNTLNFDKPRSLEKTKPAVPLPLAGDEPEKKKKKKPFHFREF